MKSKTVLILGASSDIAKSLAQKFGSKGYNLLLAARNKKEVQNYSSDLKEKYDISIDIYEFDILKTENHGDFIKNLRIIPSILICSIGLMDEQKESEKKSNFRTKVLRTNFEGPINIISDFANIFEDQRHGTIVGISSVAGERGRAKNYIYGSSKAGFTTFLSGLRNRLSKKNVHVLTVLPGPVFTKMTKNTKLPVLLTAKPEQVAKDIFLAVIKKKDVIYTLKIWRLILIIIKLIPEKLFKRINI